MSGLALFAAFFLFGFIAHALNVVLNRQHHAPRFAHPSAKRMHDLGQVFGADGHKGDRADDKKLTPANV